MPSPRDLPKPGIEPMSFMPPALAGRFFTTSTTWEALYVCIYICMCVCECVYSFFTFSPIIGYYKIIRHSSLCYTVGTCWLSVLCIVVYIF